MEAGAWRKGQRGNDGRGAAVPSDEAAEREQGMTDALQTSRLIVQNLPKHADEEKMRSFFSELGGTVTDAKVCRTKSDGGQKFGPSRRFGFVGFKTVDEAVRACEYFNDTYMDSSRIKISYAQKVHSASIPRPWSKYSEGSSRYAKIHGSAGGATGAARPDGTRDAVRERHMSEAEHSALNDEGFQEFLRVVRGGRKSEQALGNNADYAAGAAPEPEERAVDPKTERKNTGFAGPERDEEDASEDTDDGPDLEIKDSVARDEKVSDLDYFKSRVVANFSDDDDDDDDNDGDDSDSGEESSDGDSSEEEEEEEEEGTDHGHDAPMSDEADVGAAGPDGFDDECTRLFVRNLAYSCTEAELRDAFDTQGTSGDDAGVMDCHIVVDKESGRSKGIGFVSFGVPEQARRALETMDGSVFQGRLIHVMQARSQGTTGAGADPQAAAGEGAQKKSFKERREEERRKMSESERHAWNTLFMRADTVAARVAEKYGVDKVSLLLDDGKGDGEDGASGGNVAVKMALGEAQVIAETKASLEQEGVRVDVIENLASSSATARGGAGATPRSKSVVLIKNLPSLARRDDLLARFEKFGDISRFIMPSTRTMAVVEYVEEVDARRAFRALAYSRYHHVPLYLEWAPVGMLGDDTDGDGSGGQRAAAGGAAAGARAEPAREDTSGGVGAKGIARAAAEANGEDEDEAERNAMRVLYVKNLSFSTDERALEKFCKALKVRPKAVTIVRRRVDKKNRKSGSTTSTMQSLGYGFLEFLDAASATRALRALHGELLDGHKLQCTTSSKADGANGHRAAPKAASSAPIPGGKADLPPTPKLLIRNVAFQATKQELKSLFKPFGVLKNLRLPRKFDGSHRGFAFVEYSTRQEAAQAMRSLASAHLYGRHVVIEPAAADSDSADVSELRRRTRERFEGSEAAATAAKKSMRTDPSQTEVHGT